MATFQVKQPNFQQQQQSKTSGKSPLELIIAQQALAQNADAKTLAGFAFGKLLRGIFDDWKERYDARGEEKYMGGFTRNIGRYLDRIMQPGIAQPFDYISSQQTPATPATPTPTTPATPATPTPTTPTTPATPTTPTTPEIQLTQPVANPAPQINTDWLKTDNKPWENPDNWRKSAGLPTTQKLLGDSDSLTQRAVTTDEPFKLVGDNDYFNPNQWNNFDDALKIFRARRGW